MILDAYSYSYSYCRYSASVISTTDPKACSTMYRHKSYATPTDSQNVSSSDSFSIALPLFSSLLKLISLTCGTKKKRGEKVIF